MKKSWIFVYNWQYLKKKSVKKLRCFFKLTMHGRAVGSPGFCTMWGSAASGKQTIGTLKSSISGRNISWMNDKKIEDAWCWLKIAPKMSHFQCSYFSDVWIFASDICAFLDFPKKQNETFFKIFKHCEPNDFYLWFCKAVFLHIWAHLWFGYQTCVLLDLW